MAPGGWGLVVAGCTAAVEAADVCRQDSPEPGFVPALIGGPA